MTERQLNLLERSMSDVGELRESAAEIMRRDVNSDVNTVTAHDVEDGLGRDDNVSQYAAAFVYCPEERAAGQAGRRRPLVHHHFRPRRHRHRSQPIAFAHQIRDHPAAVTLLDLLKRELDEFRSPKPTANQKG